jgi:hypothetical protein
MSEQRHALALKRAEELWVGKQPIDTEQGH